MGALEAPQDRHKQERWMGPSRAEQTDRDHGGAGNSGSHGGAGSSVVVVVVALYCHLVTSTSEISHQPAHT